MFSLVFYDLKKPISGVSGVSGVSEVKWGDLQSISIYGLNVLKTRKVW